LDFKSNRPSPIFRPLFFAGCKWGKLEGGKMPRPLRSDPKTRTHALELRKELTPAERKLWSKIRSDQLGVNFRRQHAIGKYIPDFVCIQKKLIIELDGSQHLEQEEYDEERTECLKSQGYRVIRFWNNDVMNNIEGVMLVIMNALEKQE
jgi:very-short-patch-repair endonuclease